MARKNVHLLKVLVLVLLGVFLTTSSFLLSHHAEDVSSLRKANLVPRSLRLVDQSVQDVYEARGEDGNQVSQDGPKVVRQVLVNSQLTVKSSPSPSQVSLESSMARLRRKEKREEGVPKKRSRMKTKETSRTLVVLVTSARADVNKRQAFRSTIQMEEQTPPGIRVRFLVESGAEPAGGDIEESDILVVEGSSSPSEKIKAGFKWVAEMLPKTEYVAVVRDDSLVSFAKLLETASSFPFDDYFVLGNLLHGKVREKEGPLADSVWRPDEYPVLPQDGSGFIVSRPVYTTIAKNSANLANFPTEGISIGVWLAGMRVKWVHNGNVFRLVNRCMSHAAVVAGPFLPEDMLNCKELLEKKQDGFGMMAFEVFNSMLDLRVFQSRVNEDLNDVRLIVSAKSKIESEAALHEDISKKADLVILILSARSNLERRRDMRDMLASQGSLPENVVVRFVVGLGEGDLEDTQDIIEMPALDSYSSLPKKLKYGYEWVASLHPEAQFVLKCDDDQAIWPSRVLSFLQQYSSKDWLVIGGVRRTLTVHRDGKWAEHERWEPVRYPQIALGSYGHIVSRPVFQYIAENAHALYEYQGEDTSLGIWLAGFRVVFHNVNDVMRNNLECKGNPIVVGHNIVGRKALLDCLQQSESFPDEVIPRRTSMDWPPVL